MRENEQNIKGELADMFAIILLGAMLTFPITSLIIMPLFANKPVIGDIALCIFVAHFLFVFVSLLATVYYDSWKKSKCPHFHTQAVSGGGYADYDETPWSGMVCLDCGAIINIHHDGC